MSVTTGLSEGRFLKNIETELLELLLTLFVKSTVAKVPAHKVVSSTVVSIAVVVFVVVIAAEVAAVVNFARRNNAVAR